MEGFRVVRRELLEGSRRPKMYDLERKGKM